MSTWTGRLVTKGLIALAGAAAVLPAMAWGCFDPAVSDDGKAVVISSLSPAATETIEFYKKEPDVFETRITAVTSSELMSSLITTIKAGSYLGHTITVSEEAPVCEEQGYVSTNGHSIRITRYVLEDGSNIVTLYSAVSESLSDLTVVRFGFGSAGDASEVSSECVDLTGTDGAYESFIQSFEESLGTLNFADDGTSEFVQAVCPLIEPPQDGVSACATQPVCVLPLVYSDIDTRVYDNGVTKTSTEGDIQALSDVRKRLKNALKANDLGALRKAFSSARKFLKNVEKVATGTPAFHKGLRRALFLARAGANRNTSPQRAREYAVELLKRLRGF